jgi:hypothetical protein
MEAYTLRLQFEALFFAITTLATPHLEDLKPHREEDASRINDGGRWAWIYVNGRRKSGRNHNRQLAHDRLCTVVLWSVVL